MKYYAPLLDVVCSTNVLSDTHWLIPLWETPEVRPNSSLKNSHQFIWDSVSLGLYQACARKYKWTILFGYHLDPMPSPLSFGIYYHSCMETWHKLLASGMDKETALFRCVRLAGLFGEHIVPNRTERTKETLIRAVVWYLDQFKDDMAITTLRPNGSPAVEYSFMIPIMEINGQQQFLAGHIDRIVEFMGEIYILDYKTSKSALNERFFASFKPSTQISNYLLAAKIMAGTISAIPRQPKGLIIDGIQLGVNFTRFNRSVIPFSTLEINEHIKDLESWLLRANADADANHWPANPASCSNYGGCVFQSICASTPAKWDRMLESNFCKSTWDPGRAR